MPADGMVAATENREFGTSRVRQLDRSAYAIWRRVDVEGGYGRKDVEGGDGRKIALSGQMLPANRKAATCAHRRAQYRRVLTRRNLTP